MNRDTLRHLAAPLRLPAVTVGGAPPAEAPSPLLAGSRLASVNLYDGDGLPAAVARTGQPLLVEVRARVARDVADPSVRLSFVRRDGLVCCVLDSSDAAAAMEPMEPATARQPGARVAADADAGPAQVRISLSIDALALLRGQYRVDAELRAQRGTRVLDVLAGPRFAVRTTDFLDGGVVAQPARWSGAAGAAAAATATPGAEPGEAAGMVGVQIEATSACNLTCPHCYIFNYDRPVEERNLSWETFTAAVAGAPRPWHADLGGWGEPLLNRAIYDMVRWLRDRGTPGVIFSTNAALLTEDAARRLIEAGLTDLNVSIDSAAEPTHERLREGSNLATVKRNLRRLSDLKRALGVRHPRVQTSFVLSRENVDELPAFVEMTADLGLDEVVVRNLIPMKTEEIGDVMYSGFYAGAAPDAARRDRRVREAREIAWERGVVLFFLGPLTIDGPLDRCFCNALDSPFVNAAGEVSPCCFLGHPLNRVMRDGSVVNHGVVSFGNVRKAPLHEIWRSPDFALFRRRHAEGTAPQCRDCPALYLFRR